MNTVSLLSMVARIHPEAWDAVIPRWQGRLTRGDLVSLNPQPLPPGPPPDTVLLEAAAMSHELVRFAVEADIRGENAMDRVYAMVDDWCGTPWPGKWPWPWPDPRDAGGPHPDPWQVDRARLVGAIVFASAASRLADGEVKSALAGAAERLAEAASER
jgi:hypothetical protein